ncbi:MAG: ribonuclease protein component, partial [Frankiales bacterium]|nr:ribonuclease protein component [Frankiales bacterium]
MLPEAHRLRSSTEFSEVVRRGRRSSRPLLTVHALLSSDDASPVRAGLVVSKAVGGSVVRHRTSRRLRHLLRDRVAALPAGARLVVR